MVRSFFLLGFVAITSLACSSVAWEPAPAPHIPVPPKPEDSVVKEDVTAGFFDADDDDDDKARQTPEAPKPSETPAPAAPAPAP